MIEKGTKKKGWALRTEQNLKAAYRLVNNILENQNHFNSFLRRRKRNYVLRNDKGNLKAFAILGRNKYYKFPSINLIGAAPGQGYGTVLMNRILNNAAARGYEIVFIHDPVTTARSWYRTKFGAVTETKMISGNTTMMRASTKRKRQASPPAVTSRQIGPSRQSPKRPSSSRGPSAQRS